MPLTRAEILKAKDCEIKEVAVPAWGDTVFIKSLSLADRNNYESQAYTSSQLTDPTKKAAIYAKLKLKVVMAGLCDANGVLLFGGKNAVADYSVLEQHDAKVMTWLSEEILKLSGMWREDEEEEESETEQDLKND